MIKCPLLVLIAVSLAATLLQAAPAPGHKNKGTNTAPAKTQQPVDLLLKELEGVHVTLNRVYSLSDQGFNTNDIAKELPAVQKGLSLIKEKMGSPLSLADVNNLQMYDVMLDDISEKLDQWKSRLLTDDKELVKLNAEMKAFNSEEDTVLRKRAIDSSYRKLISEEIANIRLKWAQTSALSKADFERISNLQAQVSAAWFLSVDLQDKVLSGMNHFWVEVLHRNYPFIWLGAQNKTGTAVVPKDFIKGQESILNFYIGHNSGACLVLFLVICGFFAWSVFTFYRLGKLIKKSGEQLRKLTFPARSTPLVALLLFFVLVPFLDINTPALYQGLMQLLVCVLLAVLLRKTMSQAAYLYFIVSSLLFVAYFLLSNVFTYHYSIRVLLLLISAASCLTGIGYLRVLRGTNYDTPFLRSTIWIATILSGIGAISNIFGWMTLSIQLGSAATYGLIEAFALLTVVRIINNALMLEALRKGYDYGDNRPMQNRELRHLLNKYLVFFMIIAWVITLTDNLNVFDYLFTETQNFLDTTWKVGSTQFTPGNLLLFFLILYVSSLLQKFTGYFFADESDADNPDFKRKGSRLAVIRLVLLIVGFLFAIAASGLPLDKITILLGALGVGIGLGLQNIVHNLVSGIILIFERPFQIGDLVEVGTRKGRVKDIGIRSSKLITTEGSEVIVPNGDLLSERVVNWTYSNNNVRVELLVKLAPGSDIELAKTVIAEELDNQRLIYRKIKPEIFLNNFVESGIELKILAWINDVHDELSFRSDFLSKLFASLREKGIQMI